MSDTLTNLLQAQHGQSVLQGIANPQLVNPLAAQNSAVQAAGNVYGLRGQQAQEAAGQAFQNSIDPNTGQPDQALLMQNLRNPRAAMAAQEAAQKGLTLDTGTYNLHNARMTSMMSGMGQLIADNPNGVPIEAAQALIDHRQQLGLITPQEAQAMKGRLNQDPIKNTQLILQGMASNLSAQTALQAAKPQIGTVETGQGVQGVQTPATLSSTGQPGSISPVGVRVATGLPSVSKMLEQVEQPADATTAAQLGIPVGTTITIPLIQRWIQQGAGGLVQGNIPGAPATAAPATPALPVNPNAPGGRIVPAQPALQPKPAAGAPAATTAAPAPAPAATTPAPAFTPVVTGQPPGRAEDITQWQVANAAMPDAKRNETSGLAALEALKLAHTGPGTGNVNAVKAFMIAQGIPGSDMLDSGSAEAYQLARKNLLRFAQSNGTKVGTDLGLSTQIESNANVDTLLNNVNDHILKQDLGLARQRMAQQLTAPDKGTGKTDFGVGQGEHVKNFTNQTDPVAFAWDLLDENERAAHLAQIAKQEGGMEKWKRSMKIARDTGLIKVPTAPDRRSEIMPPMMPGPQPNALLA